MSFPKYPAYKDSRVEWIGEIPVGWLSTKLKRVASLKSGAAITAAEIYPLGKYPVYGGNGIRGYTDNFTHNGLFPIIGRQGALCGNVTVGSGMFWASEHAVVATPHTTWSPQWAGYLLEAMKLGQYSISAAQPGLAVERISELEIPIPPPPEQQAIASFLDRECGKIDALIAEQERLIALLAEKRQAVISHAVTKGLNRNSPMKDSGIQWIGMVPEGWEVKPLYQVCSEIMTGPFGTVLGNDDYIEGGIPIINPSHIFSGKFSPDSSVSVSPRKANELSNWRLNENDVICARRGEIGRAALVSKSEQGWICGTGSIVVRANEKFILGPVST